jgi:transposase-like protein
MVLADKTLKEIIEEKDIKSMDDLNGFMAEVFKDLVGSLYKSELNHHITQEKLDSVDSNNKPNYRNGYGKKTVKSQYGNIDLTPPRDRNGTFEPEVIKKRQTDITGMEDKVISMFALGLSTRDIQSHIKEIYGFDMSPQLVSDITDTVIEKAQEWQSRALEDRYAIVYMDAIVLKQRVDGMSKNTAVYGLIGITLEGKKECLGLYITSNAESSKFWYSVLNGLKTRGVKDVLIFAVDNLNGMSEAIKSVFPLSDIQKCVVHQIRNSLAFVSWKDRKEMAKYLKPIYTAIDEEKGYQELETFAKKWDKKYPHVSQAWIRNWEELATFYKYGPEIRKLIYTTNPIESFNRGLKKVCKNKCTFPTENAILKQLYLATVNIEKKWTTKIRDWGLIYSQLCLIYEERIIG